jgi:peptide deformylase
MILPIVAFGSPILRKKCVNITSCYPDLEILLANMWETMYDASGVGLAAPQINKSIRLFLVDTTPFIDDEEDEIEEEVVKKVFINAKITKESGHDWDFNEGCLSIPEVREDISRKSSITIEYFDENFKKHIDVYEGLSARVIQHEHDHINGILFTDKISPLRKRMIKSKLIDITKGRLNPNYKMKYFK